MAAPKEPKAVVTLQEFLGDWQDERGNPVIVEKPPKDKGKDLHVTIDKRQGKKPFWLTIRPTQELGGFTCGSFRLDFNNSHSNHIRWIGLPESKFEGKVSTWVRTQPGSAGAPPNTNWRDWSYAHDRYAHNGYASAPPARSDATPSFFEDLSKRLALLFKHKDMDRFVEAMPQEPLHRFISQAARGSFEQEAWAKLSSTNQQDVQNICSVEGTNAYSHVAAMLQTSSRSGSSAAVSSMPEDLMDALHKRILSLVGRQTDVGSKIVELSSQTKQYQFLQCVVRGDVRTCRKLWSDLDENFRRELLCVCSADEGNQSDERLLRIIDPTSHTVLASSDCTTSAETSSGSWGSSGWSSSSSSYQHNPDQGRWKSYSSSNTNWQNDGAEHGQSDGLSYLESISKKLSYVLRHDTKVPMRPDGFCRLSDVLALQRFQGCTIADVKKIVDGVHESGNSKQRFQVKDDEAELLIRANQGFSRKDIVAESAYRSLSLTQGNLPDPCVHGTYRCYWQSILERGLVAGGLSGPQGRNEIHFACEEPPALGGTRRAISGMRHDTEIVIYLNVRSAMEAGLPFYISDNDVILSPGDDAGSISSRYFLKAMDISVKPPRQLWPTS